MHDKTIIEMASTFPRWEGDTEPGFVYAFCKRISSNYNVIALAPHYPGAKQKEDISKIKVYRFKYFITGMQKLAYQSGIPNNIKNNKSLLLLIPFFLFFNCIYLIRLIKNIDIDIIHAHWIIPQGLVAVIAKVISGKKIPILITSHGSDLFSFNSYLMHKLKIWVISKCNHITVVSNAMKDYLLELGIEKDKISVIPMGIDLKNSFYPKANTPIKKNSVLFVGRLIPEKGVDVLIESLKFISPGLTGVTLNIVGSGPEKERLEILADKIDYRHTVNFIKAMPNSELPDIYRQHQIFVIPSIGNEGLGLTTIEAIGCGCTVIASDFKAIEDIIKHNDSGIIVPQKSPKELGRAINTLLTDTNKAQSLSKKAMIHVQERFDWDQIAKKYSELIDSIS